MGINEKDIQHLADLAKLNLADNEVQKQVEDMEKIIRYSMKKLSELETENINPMEHVLPIRNVFRNDYCNTSFGYEKILRNAPVHEKGYFKVPKVMDGN